MKRGQYIKPQDPEAIRSEERERVLSLAKRYVSGSDYHQLRREAGAGVNVEQKDAIQEAADPGAFMRKAKEIRAAEGCTMTEAIRKAHVRHPGLHRALMQKGGDR